MDEKTVVNVVGVRCQPELEAKFNKWYHDVHIPLLLKFDGLKEVTSYKILHDNDGYPNYLTIFKFENQTAFENYEKSPELKAAKEEKAETWSSQSYENKWRIQYEELKTWRK